MKRNGAGDVSRTHQEQGWKRNANHVPPKEGSGTAAELKSNGAAMDERKSRALLLYHGKSGASGESGQGG